MSYILITGGAGFIGSYLCKKLLGLGYKIIIVDNFNDAYDYRIKILNICFAVNKKIKNLFKKNKIENIRYFISKINSSQDYIIYYINIVDYKKMKDIFINYKIRSVIHLAALTGVRCSIKEYDLYTKNNLTGTLNILNLCCLFKIKKFIFSSSSSVYGMTEKKVFNETDVSNKTISYYAYTKLNCETMLYLYHYLYNINVVILRLFNVYGPRQRPDLVLYKFTNLIYLNKPVCFFGKGINKRDYTYVDDVVAGIVKSYHYLDNVQNNIIYEILNIGSGRSIALIELVKIIEFFLSKKAIIKIKDSSCYDVLHTCADLYKANKIINYYPDTCIITGVFKFVKWFIKNEKNDFIYNA